MWDDVEEEVEELFNRLSNAQWVWDDAVSIAQYIALDREKHRQSVAYYRWRHWVKSRLNIPKKPRKKYKYADKTPEQKARRNQWNKERWLAGKRYSNPVRRRQRFQERKASDPVWYARRLQQTRECKQRRKQREKKE